MKKYIFSPLCSALVIPGLGQILNHNFKKGLFLLLLVFILFIAGTVKLSLVVRTVLGGSEISKLDPKMIAEKIQGQDLTVLWLLLIAFAVVWGYSVLDAFWTGRKLERETEDAVR